MSASLGLLVPVLLSLGAPPPGATSDYNVVDPPMVSAEDEDLTAWIEPGAQACGVWRAALGGKRSAVLAAFCFEAAGAVEPAVARWTLSVVRTKDSPKRLARVVLAARDEPLSGCGARGLLRVRRDVLAGEPVLEVGWGCRSEGDGMFPGVELWRVGPKGLTRLFRMPSSTGADPYGTAYGVSWRPAPPRRGAPHIEVTWSYHSELSSGDGEPAWSGEQRLLHRFDGSEFRPPADALLLASAYASAWLPPSPVADYAPPRAFDDRNETAWCTDAAQKPWLSVQLAAPTRLGALRIVPGYAKSEAVFRDNARIARIRVEAGAAGETRASFEAELADELRPQEIVVPSGTGAIDWIRVTVLEIRTGRRFQDVCISDLRVVPRAPGFR